MPEHFSQNRIESLDPNQEAVESLAERLNLREQYLAQVKVLYQSGILENFAVDPSQDRYTPEIGITGVDGKQYIMPSYEDILERLQDQEKRAFIEKKIDQGLTKLQIVPFAMPLSILRDRYKELLLKVNKETGIKSTDGTKLELDTANPLFFWDELVQSDNPDTEPAKQIEYGVTNYDGQTKDEREGKYKSELLQNPDNAWDISLIEANPDIPAEGKDQTINGRKQLEANKSSKEYLKLFQSDPQYQGEKGQTPEGVIFEAITALIQKQTAISDQKTNFCVGSFVSGGVPSLCWDRRDRRPHVGRDDPDDRVGYNGCRPEARF